MKLLQYFFYQNLGILPGNQYIFIDRKCQSHKILFPGQLLQRNTSSALPDPAKVLFFRFRLYRLFSVHQQIIAVRSTHSLQQKSGIQCGFFDSCLIQYTTAFFIAFTIGHRF